MDPTEWIRLGLVYQALHTIGRKVGLGPKANGCSVARLWPPCNSDRESDPRGQAPSRMLTTIWVIENHLSACIGSSFSWWGKLESRFQMWRGDDGWIKRCAFNYYICICVFFKISFHKIIWVKIFKFKLINFLKINYNFY